MTQEEKVESLADLFDCEVGALTPETALDSLAWDSMAMLSVIAMLKTQFGKKLSGAEIRKFEKVGDILSAMN